MEEATVYFAKATPKLEVKLEDPQPIFLAGPEPQRLYQVEVDDEEMFEAAADRAGLLEIENVPAGKTIGIRIRLASAAP